MKPTIFLFFIAVFIFLSSSISAQEPQEETRETLTYNDFIPGLLVGSSRSLQNLATYEGYSFSWHLRSEKSNGSYFINGINFETNNYHWQIAPLLYGLYSSFNVKENYIHHESSKSIYNKGQLHLYATDGDLLKKRISFDISFSNRNNNTALNIHFQNPQFYKKWNASFHLYVQSTPIAAPPLGYKKTFSSIWSLDKQWINKNKFVFTLWTVINNQSKTSSSVAETFFLTKSNQYNPAWGWYHQNILYPSTKSSAILASTISYLYQKGSILVNNSIGFAIGSQSNTGLEWTNTVDPRPDYYRYLPSYVKDSNLKTLISQRYQQNPQLLQIDFDKIEKINKSSLAERSFYIINETINEALLLRYTGFVDCKVQPFWKFNAGANLAYTQVKQNQIIRNLLGGSYYLNYNSWINDDGQAFSMQNEQRIPDQKIKINEQWGPSYFLYNASYNTWAQVSNIAKRVESNFGFHFSGDEFQREGLNKNGLFGSSSLGKSNLLFLPNWGWQGQFLYKFSGRIYAKSIVYSATESPTINQIYIDPDLQANTQPFLYPIISQGVDLSFFYRAPACKVTLATFFKHKEQEGVQKMFYHDKYNAFVYGFIGGINTQVSGVEFLLESKLWQWLDFQLATTLTKANYSNNPEYIISKLNDLTTLETGLLYLKNLPSSASPAIVNVLSLQSNFNNGIRWGLVILKAAKKSIDYDLFRRSSSVYDHANASQWEQIKKPEFLKEEWMTSCFIAKSMLINRGKNKYPLNISVSVKNMLNNQMPVIVYEQSRFDYQNYEGKKFPLKYIYDQGLVFNLHLQFQLL